MRSCWRFARAGRVILVLVLGSFAAILPTPWSSSPMAQDPTCLPGETRRPEDTVSTPAEKSLAFEAVITSDGVYGDYRFVLDTSSTPSGFIVPVLSQSIAGLESSWSQYTETNETILGVNTDGTCDYGMMQVNSGQAYLFNLARCSQTSRLASGLSHREEHFALAR